MSPSATPTAMVTGGAEGIGQAYAARLAEDGYDLIVLDRLPADATGKRVASTGRKFSFVRCDLADAGQVKSVAEEVIARHGGCDVLVNNAAIGSQRSFDSTGFDDVRQMLAVNLEAPFLLAQAMVPEMRRRGWGRIINITSGAFNMPIGGFVDYLMSKGGLLGLTRALATEVGAYGITVNAIAPGLVRTPMTTGGRAGHAPLPQQVFDMVKNLQSIKRSQVPEDLLGTLSFLASTDSDMMTGQVISCGGGIIRL